MLLTNPIHKYLIRRTKIATRKHGIGWTAKIGVNSHLKSEIKKEKENKKGEVNAVIRHYLTFSLQTNQTVHVLPTTFK